MLTKYLWVFFVSMVPLVELRGSIIISQGLQLPVLSSYIVAIIGNMLPVPVIYLFARKVLVWGADKPVIGKFFSWCLEKGEKGNPSVNFLTKKFSEMSSLPRAFVCANDFVAIDAMNALKSLGYEIPQDVYLLGFDDSSESRVVRPQISTVHIHSQVMGFTATELILSRIKNPDMNYRTCFCESNLILRESTGDTPV